MTVRELYDELGEVLRKHGNVEVTVVQDRFFVIEIFYKLQSVRVEQDSDGEFYIALDPRPAGKAI